MAVALSGSPASMAAGTSNFWARPIEGVVAVVDLDERRVIRLIDTGPVKLGAKSGDFGARPLRDPAAAAGRCIGTT